MECIALRDSVLTVTYNGFSNLKIIGGSKVIINCYNKKKSNLSSSIIVLMDDIWRLSWSLNIFNCCHIYRESNIAVDCLAKKHICNSNSNI